ncbi:SAM-dependent methyltransferase [Saccharothrix coeruleofusca]|uniref:class I SAM-dependent methyltransferase n=1 Tax=Saccharothrix coeruleofusca TaxID=33919 RepID=UPI0027DD4D2B|nr:class I SAM-dependent methyltransferase [Saccharothrix coeruleofusca]MBP2340989.1 SAM-dependent methyltransferase [Saccharothrix coeruleofusca]
MHEIFSAQAEAENCERVMGNRRHGLSESEQYWEAHYNTRRRLWSGRANPVLTDVADGLPTGAALDLGCGEGGDAVWLARRGWRVTAVDVSATALARAEAHAAEAGVEIRFERHDLAHTFPQGAFDLVSAQYLQSPVDFPRAEALRRAADAVRPGGLLLVVDHGAPPPWSPNLDVRFPTPEETLAGIGLDDARWRTERMGSPRRQGTGPDGQTGVLVDNVLALRRLPA